MVMDFPLIYCNGDSFSNEHYHPSLVGKTYVNFVADYCHGFAINKAQNASSNRRIIRTTVHDMIQQQQLNPHQKTIALIQLTTSVRSEIWLDDKSDELEEESNFVQVQFANKPDWRERLLKGKDSNPNNGPVSNHNISKKYWDKLTEGLAYFHNGQAEYINLLCDLIMLQTLLESLNIDFIIFSGPQEQQFESSYLLEFFRNKLQKDKRYIDFESFGFCAWSAKQNYIPLDTEPNTYIGHYGPDAHEAFAKQIIIPKLKELNII
jgi:hypothetical protein